MNQTLEEEIAASILGYVSAGLAVFGAADKVMRWRNNAFRKQTWFGGAFGGKAATRVTLLDLFEAKDHEAILELFNIAVSMGQSYDFQRLVRRGPVGSFPAELRFHKIGIGNDGAPLICLEISDLSLNKLYDELQTAHGQIRERLADLMTTQAELQYSVRMNTISEFGADLAHHLLNPVTMARDTINTCIAPVLANAPENEDVQNVLRYLKDIENFAVWFRKFSNPRITETQICRVLGMVEDTLNLNLHRFVKQGVNTKIRKEESCNPFILAIPVDLIMWLNAAFSEICNVIEDHGGFIYIDLAEDQDSATLVVHSNAVSHARKKMSTGTLEKLARRLPGSIRFTAAVEENQVSFSLHMPAFHETEPEDQAISKSLSSGQLHQVASPEEPAKAKTEASPSIRADYNIAPLVLLVDDEPDIRKLLKRQFENMGVECVEAADGLEALQIFQNPEHRPTANRIRAIISDIRMPHMTGPHLLVALREANVQLPFIFFSSNLVEQGQQGEGFRYEGVHYLTKESGLEELKSIIGSVMKQLAEENSKAQV
jgi:CheY-like chemotaxis protein/signal transduction histidine kinase